jgi:phosphomannomutase
LFYHNRSVGAYCIRPIAYAQLHTPNCIRPIAYNCIRQLHTPNCIRPIAYAQLHTPNYIRPIAYAQLHTPNCIRPITYAQLHTPNCIRPIAKKNKHMNIKFGTDGWRAIIAQDFTTFNVARVAEATARFITAKNLNPAVVIGYDCRFGGLLFAETTAKVIASLGIKVYLDNNFVTTPMVAMVTKDFNAGVGVVITASHNPPLYNGYKLKGHFGGPLMEEEILEVEALIPDFPSHNPQTIQLEDLINEGKVEIVDMETIYCTYLEQHFDLAEIRNSGLHLAFDAMYGSGQNVMRRLFPDISLLHCYHQPLFDGIPPEPLEKNLLELSEMIRNSKHIDCGLAVDGDADRIALFNHKGEYVDSHHVILLLIYYLHHYKNLSGKIATGFSSTVKINKLCDAFGLPLDIVKIGFKHICQLMLHENILVGGEESGGIAVAGHIPERDGIYNGILIWEALVKTGKSLQDLIEEVYAITGSFAFERSDLHISPEDKLRIVTNCQKGYYKSFGEYKIIKTETLDGFKYFFSDSQWLMIRPSGTEPVLRTYAEGATRTEALHILNTAYETIMKKS